MAKKQSRKAKSGNSSVAAALAEMNELFDSTPAQQGGTGLPDGKYQCLIEEAKIEHSQSGRLQVTFKLKVAGGDFINRVVYKRDGIDNEQAIGWFKGGMARLGFGEDELSASTLPETLKELEGTFCVISAKNKDNSEWTNYYFDSALDDDEVDADGLETLDGDDEVDEDEETEAASWSKGDKVQVDFDGDWYQGTIKSIDEDEETATVKFEDGTTEEVAFDDLEAFAPDEDEDEDEEEAEEDEDEEAEEDEEDEDEDEASDGVTLNFDESKITAKQQKELAALAKDNDFEPDDYEDWSSLLTDILEYLEVTGEFTTPAAAIKAAKSAAE